MFIGYVVLKAAEALFIGASRVIHGASFGKFYVNIAQEGKIRIIDTTRASASWVLRKTPDGVYIDLSESAKEYYADVSVEFENGIIPNIAEIDRVWRKLKKEELSW